jgi:hypothetical protein
MAIQLGSAYGKVSIDSSGVKSGVDNANKSLGTLETSARKLGASLQKIGGAMTLGLTVPIIGFFKQSVNSAMDAESAFAEVEAVLKSTGGAAGVTAEDVKKLATEFQKLTKFSDEEIMSGESMLLTFTNIGADVFPMATEAMLNMGQKFGSIKDASIQLGKALNDPVAGVGALRRVGVMLTDEQEKQIKSFMAVNDVASAQKVILKELETEFGGLAKAIGNTPEGKFAKLKNSFDDLMEVVGKKLMPFIMKAVDFLTMLIDKFNAAPPHVQDLIIKFLFLVAVVGPVLFLLGKALPFALSGATKSLNPFSGGVFGLVGTFIKWVGVAALVVKVLTALGIATGPVGAGILAVQAAIAGAAGSILVIVGPILLIIATLGLLYWAFKNNWMGITDTVKQAWFLLGYYIAQIVEKVKNMFKNINWGQVGKNMLIGLANGILMGIPSIIMAAAQAGAAALEAMRKALDSHSPSRKFFKLGIDSGDGYKLGLKDSVNPAVIARMMAKPVSNMTTQQSTSNTVNLSNGLTLRDVDRLMDTKINRFAKNVAGAL